MRRRTEKINNTNHRCNDNIIYFAKMIDLNAICVQYNKLYFRNQISSRRIACVVKFSCNQFNYRCEGYNEMRVL